MNDPAIIRALRLQNEVLMEIVSHLERVANVKEIAGLAAKLGKVQILLDSGAAPSASLRPAHKAVAPHRSR